MQENKYDDIKFFEQYSNMERSMQGLKAAGEWHELKKMLPDLRGLRMLDLGCGFGWHCLYAIEQGASNAIGIDLSEKMLAEARKKTNSPQIQFVRQAIEDFNFPGESFDLVISSLALHYVDNFAAIVHKVKNCLCTGGNFVFSVEHPIFTAYGTQEWICDASGNRLYYPVDNYFIEGKRQANFLGENILKYHKTLTTYLNTLLQLGMEITNIVEPMPSKEMLKNIPEMKDELRRPMMLLISARKK